MDVENRILELIPRFLKAYDPDKIGYAIDIGVGTFSFYFEVFDKAGYQTIAVEPLPSEKLFETMKKTPNTTLVEACIMEFDGYVDIFTGVYNGSTVSDVSSVNQDWWGVSESDSLKKSVASMSFKTLISDFQIKQISYCKIDTEGSEYAIIKQLKTLNSPMHPLIVEFEYGGGCKKEEKKAGWSKKYLQNTIACIHTLFELGYKYLLLFERENDKPIEIFVDDKSRVCEIFKDYYVYGDILMMKERKYVHYQNTGKFSFSFEDSILYKMKNFFR